MSDKQRDNCGKRNEHTPPARVWVSTDKIVTFQETPAMQIYTERSLKDGSVKTQHFIKAGKP
jgi:hypothetical protein